MLPPIEYHNWTRVNRELSDALDQVKTLISDVATVYSSTLNDCMIGEMVARDVRQSVSKIRDAVVRMQERFDDERIKKQEQEERATRAAAGAKKPARVTNRQARGCVQRCEPFKGANTFGEWIGSSFVVYSYGRHWPLFVNWRGKWFENSDRYSSTTSKHRGQLHPHAETEPMECDAMKKWIEELKKGVTR